MKETVIILLNDEAKNFFEIEGGDE